MSAAWVNQLFTTKLCFAGTRDRGLWAARLKGILPEGTEIAHKTGTIGRSTNDVGIITLPDGAGHLAIAVFVKSSEKDVAARERAIAEIARAAHDFFLFQPRPSS